MIIFTDHALNQLRERNIAKDSVINTLDNPDKIFLQTNFRKRAVKLFKRHRKKYAMVVVYEEVDNNKKAITVFLTSKIKKYL